MIIFAKANFYVISVYKVQESRHLRAVEERLDRALANSMWFNLLAEAKLENLVAPSSDHYPILLDCNPIMRHSLSRRNFHFENA